MPLKFFSLPLTSMFSKYAEKYQLSSVSHSTKENFSVGNLRIPQPFYLWRKMAEHWNITDPIFGNPVIGWKKHMHAQQPEERRMTIFLFLFNTLVYELKPVRIKVSTLGKTLSTSMWELFMLNQTNASSCSDILSLKKATNALVGRWLM